LLLPVPVMASAKPVYLRCQKSEATRPFDVTVDEATVKVSQTGKPIFDAQFTATEIKYQLMDRGRAMSTIEKFTINRQNLELTSTWSVGGNDGAGHDKEVRSVAKCEVVVAPERKIY